MSIDNSKKSMDLTEIKMEQGQATKEDKVELRETNESTIFTILNLPELDKEGNKV